MEDNQIERLKIEENVQTEEVQEENIQPEKAPEENVQPEKTQDENIPKINTEIPNVEAKKSNGKYKKIIIISISAVVLIGLIIGLILFFVNKIPSKYYGTYVSYHYYDGYEYKTTYEITPLSVKSMLEYETSEGKQTTTRQYDYYKKGEDVIVKNEESEYYLIIDDECLYLETNKDISFSKKYGSFFWNVNSDKADIYEIRKRADSFEELIETTMSSWARKFYYDGIEEEVPSYSFYITTSDEETDETDLNTYKVKYKAANGDLTFSYDRKSKELKNVYFSGMVMTSSLTGNKAEYMSVKDSYDCKAMLYSLMYILGNKNNIKLNTYSYEEEHIKDLLYRLELASDWDKMIENKKTDSQYSDKKTYSIDNDKYSISYTTWITSSVYSVSGLITFNISLK